MLLVDCGLDLLGLWTFLLLINNLSGSISESTLWENCSLQVLDLSGNNFSAELSGKMSNCKNLVDLNLWGNNFTGLIPAEIGSISTLEGLFLGRNSFDRVIPETSVNLQNLAFLDSGKNEFGGDIQEKTMVLVKKMILYQHWIGKLHCRVTIVDWYWG
ncbi:hypothetical protein SLE2022_291190 [Rubroshorea leprosula]